MRLLFLFVLVFLTIVISPIKAQYDSGDPSSTDTAATGSMDASFDSTDSNEGEGSGTVSPPSVPEFIPGSPTCFNGVPVNFSWSPSTNTAFYNVARASSAPGDTGLLGRYYDSKNLGVPMFTRIDPTVDFGSTSTEYWNLGAPKPVGVSASLLNPDTFSVRWTGKIKPPFTGDYTFKVEAKDGVRLFLDDQPLIKSWGNSKDVKTYQKTFTHSVANQTYNLRLEYRNNEDEASVKLIWIRPASNGAAPTIEEVIPQAQLTPTFNNNISPVLLNAASPIYGQFDIPQEPVVGQINKMIYNDGLYAEYFDNDDLKDTPSKFKTEPSGAATTFSLVDSNPTDNVVDYLDPVVNPTVFSATYKGKILTTSQGGTYTFTIRAKDQVRLYIKDTNIYSSKGEVINDWNNTGAVRSISGSVTLEANQAYDIRLDHSYSGGDGDLDLLWNTPSNPASGNPSTNGVLVPKANLYHQIHMTFNPGLQGQYYDNNTLTGSPVATRTDTQINFLNTGGTIPPPWLPSTSGGLTTPNISVRWSGKIRTGAAGLYSFKIVSSGEVKISIDKNKTSSFSKPPAGLKTSYTKPFQLDGDQLYDFKLEFKDTSANPRIELLNWVIDGTESVIPATNLGGQPILSHNNVLLKSELDYGLMGRYYDNLKNTGHTFSKVDSQLNFSYGTLAPQVSALGQSIINPDTFTVLWGGKVKAGSSDGDYDFIFNFNDGVKVYGDKKLIAGKYNSTLPAGQTQSIKGKITMKANKTSDLRVDYVERFDDASINMKWKPPSSTATPIPISNMFHGRINAGSITYQDSPPAGSYIYQVTAVGSGGNTNSVWFNVNSGGACTAPTLKLESQGCDVTNPNAPVVSLSWTSVPTAATYRIFRTDRNPLYWSIPSTQTTYADNTVVPGQTYTYQVASADGAGTPGPLSNSVLTSTIQACGGGPVITFALNQCYTTGLASQTGSWIQTGTQPIQFSAYDPVYTLNDSTAKFTLQRNPSAPAATPTPFTTGFIYPPASPAGTSRTFGRNFTHAELYPPPTGLAGTGNVYEMTASICNVRSPQRPEDCTAEKRTFDYLSNCIAPWIQTQDGGIHSNDQINFSTSGP